MTLKIEARIAEKLDGTADSILEMKGRAVHSIGPNETVYAGVEKLREYEVGALLVMEGTRLEGVFSERDYARKVILDGHSSKNTRVAEIMTSPVICVDRSTPLAECMSLITQRHIRHLPVMEAGLVVGMISIGDLVHTVVIQQAQTIETLHALISDPYPG